MGFKLCAMCMYHTAVPVRMKFRTGQRKRIEHCKREKKKESRAKELKQWRKKEHEKRNHCYRKYVIVFKCISASFVRVSFRCGVIKVHCEMNMSRGTYWWWNLLRDKKWNILCGNTMGYLAWECEMLCAKRYITHTHTRLSLSRSCMYVRCAMCDICCSIQYK